MSTDESTGNSTGDLVEIQQLLARYAVTITQGDIDGLLAVFTPDGSYSAFGDTYPLEEFPALVAATSGGWRLRTRAMTFIRRNGAHDSGRPHAYKRAGT